VLSKHLSNAENNEFLKDTEHLKTIAYEDKHRVVVDEERKLFYWKYLLNLKSNKDTDDILDKMI
jgi:hypothetical protein